MSDIFINQTSNVVKSNLTTLTNNDWNYRYSADGTIVEIRRNDRKDIWAPARKKNCYLFISGRIALTENDWALAPYDGDVGLASNYLLELYLSQGLSSLLNKLNGGYNITICQSDGRIITITDKMGVYPIYYAHRQNKITLSSNPDIIAKDNDFNQLDMTSLAEYLSYGKVEFPNTYYTNIKQLEPGCVYEIHGNKLQKTQCYFSPQFKFNNETFKQLTEELADSILTAVRIRSLPILGSTGLFLSGGADSRGILAGCHTPEKIITSTFYDEINNEFLTAKLLAKRYNAQHIGLQRSVEHYIENAYYSSKLTNGHWNLLDAHYTGFIEELLDLNVDNWLSGCFADWMFKGLASNTKYFSLLGKTIPTIKILSDYNPIYYKPKFNIIKEKLADEMENRRQSMTTEVDFTKNDNVLWNIEKNRLFPLNREADMGARHILTRSLKWDSVMVDDGLIKMFEKIPISYKIDKFIWANAIAIICAGNNDIKDNNWGTKINANKSGKIASFIVENIKRKIKGKTIQIDSIVTPGSWPNHSFVVKNSKLLPSIWSNFSAESINVIDEIIKSSIRFDNFAQLADDNIEKFYRFFTLLSWLDTVHFNKEITKR